MDEVEERLSVALKELDNETVKSITLYNWIKNSLIAA